MRWLHLYFWSRSPKRFSLRKEMGSTLPETSSSAGQQNGSSKTAPPLQVLGARRLRGSLGFSVHFLLFITHLLFLDFANTYNPCKMVTVSRFPSVIHVTCSSCKKFKLCVCVCKCEWTGSSGMFLSPGEKRLVSRRNWDFGPPQGQQSRVLTRAAVLPNEAESYVPLIL